MRSKLLTSVCGLIALLSLGLQQANAQNGLEVEGQKSTQAQTYKVLYNFSGQGTDGGYSSSSLVEDRAGNLYGTASSGGAHNKGVVFKLDKKGKGKVLYSFTGTGGDGGTPRGALVRDAAGNFYGTTYYGGDLTCNCGTVFKLDTTGKVSVLYSFRGYPDDGANPWAGVVRDVAGNLYGTTYGGGVDNTGTVFRLDTTGNETVLHSFTGLATGSTDGALPWAGLVRDHAGNLYGTTYAGPAGAGCGCGVIFKVDTSGNETVLYRFTGGADGGSPYAGLVRDAAGNLYGTTYFGGSTAACNTNGCGTVFQLDKAGKETVLYSFTGATDGANPFAGLVADKAGNLYGTTFAGGTYTYGTIFKLDTAGKVTVRHSFSYSDGIDPEARLVRDSAGNLYGTTSFGGPSTDGGVVFKVTP